MPTKIGGLDTTGPAHIGTGSSVKRASTATAGAQTDQSSSLNDTQITESARQLAALEQTVRDLPAIDEARVEQVRSAIQKGDYQIDSSKIADKLLQLEQGLDQDA